MAEYRVVVCAVTSVTCLILHIISLVSPGWVFQNSKVFTGFWMNCTILENLHLNCELLNNDHLWLKRECYMHICDYSRNTMASLSDGFSNDWIAFWMQSHYFMTRVTYSLDKSVASCIPNTKVLNNLPVWGFQPSLMVFFGRLIQSVQENHEIID